MAEDNKGPPPAADGQLAEQRMRKALGLNTGGGGARQAAVPQQRPEQARQRHRFAQDGSVPVVMLNQRPDDTGALRDRVAELQSLLEAERAAHGLTRRQLSEQQAAVQSIETRFAHAELAHRDAVAQERRAREIAQEELTAMRAATPAARRAAAAAAAAANADDDDAAEDAEADGPSEAGPVRAADAAAPKKRGRPRIHPPKEPKPLRWWTPSFKTKTKA